LLSAQAPTSLSNGSKAQMQASRALSSAVARNRADIPSFAFDSTPKLNAQPGHPDPYSCLLADPFGLTWSTRARICRSSAGLHDDGACFFVSAQKPCHGGRVFKKSSACPETAGANPSIQSCYPVYIFLSSGAHQSAHFPDNLTLASWFSWIPPRHPASAPHLDLLARRKMGQNIAHLDRSSDLLAISPLHDLVSAAKPVLRKSFFFCWPGWLRSLLGNRTRARPWRLLAGVSLPDSPIFPAPPGSRCSSRCLRGTCGRREPPPCALPSAGGMLPFILGWSLLDRPRTNSPIPTFTLIYYTPTMWKFQFPQRRPQRSRARSSGKISTSGSIAWARLISARFISACFPSRFLAQVIAIGMISGIIRMAFRGVAGALCHFWRWCRRECSSSGTSLQRSVSYCRLFPLLGRGFWVVGIGNNLVKNLKSAAALGHKGRQPAG